MKKLVLLILSVLLLTAGSAAQQYQAMWKNTFSNAGSGTSLRLIGSGVNFQKVTWTVTGVFTGCSLKVESSADNSAWNDGDILGATVCTANGNSAIVAGTYNYIRVRVTTLTHVVGSPVLTTILTGYNVNPNSAGALTDLTDLTISGQDTGDILQADSVNTWINVKPGNTPVTRTTGQAILSTHRFYWVSCSGAGAVALSIAGANSVGFENGYKTHVHNDAVGNCTITPDSGTINGAASLVLAPGQDADILAKATDDYEASVSGPAGDGTTATQFLKKDGSFGQVTEAGLNLADNTTNDATTTKHGFVPKCTNTGTKYFRDDCTWDTPAGGSGSYTMTLLCRHNGPADSTTYYCGAGNTLDATTSATYQQVYVPKAGTIVKITITILDAGTLGSAENNSIYIRINNTTDVTVGTTIPISAASSVVDSGAVSQAVSANDLINIKWTTPGWVTNPTVVFFHVTVLINI